MKKILLIPTLVTLILIIGCNAINAPPFKIQALAKQAPNQVKKDKEYCSYLASELSGHIGSGKEISRVLFVTAVGGPLGWLFALTNAARYSERKEGFEEDYSECMGKRGYVVTQAQTTLTTSEPESEEDGE